MCLLAQGKDNYNKDLRNLPSITAYLPETLVSAASGCGRGKKGLRWAPRQRIKLIGSMFFGIFDVL